GADEVLLPLPLRVELLSGASKADRKRLRRALSALPVAYPTEDTWRTIDRWIERAGEAGQRFAFGGLSLGAILSALPVACPTEDTWRTIDRWIERAGEAGQRFGFGDLLIGAIASESGALV